ncbi:MAG: hypothetical protein ACD_49C00088G0001 [uncultured bacterium (gcode 4)]|uniref:Fido domain-containing protein n=1 Tax=uncultured bacterium (gcode 4) TaxID=1234023 RepID=K2AVU0_9BACT|nr:MAG: hypothetical protein ACD_49C00088G0001 [uncultured bacterium (gcode 4)]
MLQKSKILFSVSKNMDKYLKEVLGKNIPEKHTQIKNGFQNHMEVITDYCIENYINKSELTEEFIKWLHKILYPVWFRKAVTEKDWSLTIAMTPWEYKTLDNDIDSRINIWEKVNFTKVNETEKEVNKLIQEFNQKINTIKNKNELLKFIVKFSIDFAQIHPFWDGNSRVVSILMDTILIRYSLEPVYINFIKMKNIKEMYSAAEKYRETWDIEEILKVIEKYGE